MSISATPGRVESEGEIRFSARSFSCESGIDGDVSVTKMIGASAGFTLR
jgi:hypothetical protein